MSRIATISSVLSEAQLDIVSGGMNVQIGEVSSSVRTASSGAGLGVLQQIVSAVIETLKGAESVTQRGHPH